MVDDRKNICANQFLDEKPLADLLVRSIRFPLSFKCNIRLYTIYKRPDTEI